MAKLGKPIWCVVGKYGVIWAKADTLKEARNDLMAERRYHADCQIVKYLPAPKRKRGKK